MEGRGRLVKPVDTRHLKCLGHCPCGFEPRSGHHPRPPRPCEPAAVAPSPSAAASDAAASDAVARPQAPRRLKPPGFRKQRSRGAAGRRTRAACRRKSVGGLPEPPGSRAAGAPRRRVLRPRPRDRGWTFLGVTRTTNPARPAGWDRAAAQPRIRHPAPRPSAASIARLVRPGRQRPAAPVPRSGTTGSPSGRGEDQRPIP